MLIIAIIKVMILASYKILTIKIVKTEFRHEFHWAIDI
jgi:hypothetical protein